MADYRNLEVWKLAHEMTLLVYRTTTRLPSDERFSLTAQIRRAASSVAANLAEGTGRETDQDFARFVAIAAGSVNEVEYHGLLAYDLGYIEAAEWDELSSLTGRVRSMLTRLHRTLKG